LQVLDFLRALFTSMGAANIPLSDYEAKLILPVLVEKAGHNQAGAGCCSSKK
jgi:hypothetical protein